MSASSEAFFELETAVLQSQQQRSNPMKQHRIYCGLIAPNMTESEAEQVARQLALEFFPNGHTIFQAEGVWAGAMVQCKEKTIVVEVWGGAGFGEPNVNGFAGAYKTRAEQEAVVVITQQVEGAVI